VNTTPSLDCDGIGKRVAVRSERGDYVCQGAIVAVFPQYLLVDTDDGNEGIPCGFDGRLINAFRYSGTIPTQSKQRMQSSIR
jgi:hypothetical protein